MEDKEYSSQRVKDETLEIGEMMKAYLNISGLRQEAEQLDQLCQQLQGVSTREEVDHLNTLLTDFASLDIKKSQAWCNSQDHSKKHIYSLGISRCHIHKG